MKIPFLFKVLPLSFLLISLGSANTTNTRYFSSLAVDNYSSNCPCGVCNGSSGTEGSGPNSLPMSGLEAPMLNMGRPNGGNKAGTSNGGKPSPPSNVPLKGQPQEKGKPYPPSMGPRKDARERGSSYATRNYGGQGFELNPKINGGAGNGSGGVGSYPLINNGFNGHPLSSVDIESSGNYYSGHAMLTGDYHLTRTDLIIPGRGMNWEFTRIYKQEKSDWFIDGRGYDTRFGYGWNFTYNDRIILEPVGQDSTNAYIYEGGRHRVSLWIDFNNDGDFNDDKPANYQSKLFKAIDDTLVWIHLNGTVYTYSPTGLLANVVDRAGNRLIFEHGDGVTPNKPLEALSKVTDTYGREIEYFYYEGTGTVKDGKLWKVVDFVGRELVFDYDSVGNLTSYTSPTVNQDADGNNLFPSGKTENYSYDANNYLTGIIRPNESDSRFGEEQDGTVFATIQYDLVNFGRVEKIFIGTAPNNEISFSYLDVDENDLFDYQAQNEDIPDFMCQIVDRNQHVKIIYLNTFNGVVTREEIYDKPFSDPSWPNSTRYIYRYKYVGDFLKREVLPSGLSSDFVYEQNSLGIENGNLLQQTITPAVKTDPFPNAGENPSGFIDNIQTTLVFKYSYEPIFNQILSVVDPRGTDGSYSPPIGAPSEARYTTKYFYDFQEADFTTLNSFVDNYLRRTDIPDQVLQDLLEDPVDGFDINGDGLFKDSAQLAGNRIKCEAPQVNLVGGGTQDVIELMIYNAQGQIIQDVDPEGNLDTYNYHPENDPDGDGQNLIPGLGTAPIGYLASITRDDQLPNPVPGVWPVRTVSSSPVQATNSFVYDEVGNKTKLTNPKGYIFQYDFNELNQAYRLIRAVGKGVEHEIRSEFDANDNQIRNRIWNNKSGGDKWVDHEWDYDIQDLLIREREEIEDSGSPSFIETLFQYNPNEYLSSLTFPLGNQETYEYNTRNLKIEELSAPGKPEETRTEFVYDENDNLQQLIQYPDYVGDPLNQLITTTLYDGFDRLHAVHDPIGARSSYIYDPNENIVQVIVRGHLPGPSPLDDSGLGNEILTDRSNKHDELNRVFETSWIVDGDWGGTPHSADTIIINTFEFDRSSRKTKAMENDGDFLLVEFDGRDRVVLESDAMGNTIQKIYDKNDNLLETSEIDKATIGGIADEEFTTTLEYDPLDRVTSITDNIGNSIRYKFDHQNNITKIADANGPLPDPFYRAVFGQEVFRNKKGNVIKFSYDSLNRKIEEKIFLTQNGLGNGTWTPSVDSTQGDDGYIINQTHWDDNSRILALVDDKDNATVYSYDENDLEKTVTYGLKYNPGTGTYDSTGEETTETFFYDELDRMVSMVDQNGSQIDSIYDRSSRIVQKDVLPVTGVIGTTQLTFEYDGLGRMTQATDNNFGSVTTVTRDYDTMSRLWRETQDYANPGFVAPTLAIEYFWANEDQRTDLIYPNGRNYPIPSYDSLDRPNSITLDVQSGDSANYDYIGKKRVLRRTFPNDTELTYLDSSGATDEGYDGIRRTIHKKTLETSTGDKVLHFQYTHDRMGNRKTVRRRHVYDNGAHANGEMFDYDSAYRLIDWKEGKISNSGPVPPIPPEGGEYTYGSGQGGMPFTVQMLEEDGWPGDSYALSIFNFPNQNTDDYQTWSVDGANNWASINRKGTPTNSIISPHNEYSDWGGQGFSYDSNGNLLDDGRFLYEYDFLNRLRIITHIGTGQIVSGYDYDAFNRRVKRYVSAFNPTGLPECIRYLYDGWHVIEERDDQDNLLRQFSYGFKQDEILMMEAFAGGVSQEKYYYHCDVEGSVAAITDSNGTVVERVSYNPFGQPYFRDSNHNLITEGAGKFISLSQIGNPILFTGRRYDYEASERSSSQDTDLTGLYYFRNRYLDSNRGRFIHRDPIGIWLDDGNIGNGYSYSGNNPLNVFDSMGLCSTQGGEDNEEGEEEPYKKRYKNIKVKKGDKKTRKTLERLERTKTGRRMLRYLDKMLEKNGTSITIRVEDGSGTSVYGNTGGPGGAHEIVVYLDDPNSLSWQQSNFKTGTFEGGMGDDFKVTMAAATLAHEMSHALENLTGGQNSRGIKGDWGNAVGTRRNSPETVGIRMGNQIGREFGYTRFRGRGLFPRNYPEGF